MLKRFNLRKKAGYFTLAPLTLFMITLFLAPLFEILVRSFYDNKIDIYTFEFFKSFFSSSSYISIFIRTYKMAFFVTVIVLVVGYPVAYYMASLKERTANILKIFVIVPFWISILIRTFAWKSVLSSTGVINTVLMNIGLIDEPLSLIYNSFAVYIGMIHIELPFMILSLYGVMKNIDRRYYDAALSLGARPPIAFFKVYVPMSLPGVLSGTLLVFIMSLGFYITPSLLGGTNDTMLSLLIDNTINQSMNWGLASAISVILLVTTVVIISVYNKVLGVDQLGGPSS